MKLMRLIAAILLVLLLGTTFGYGKNAAVSMAPEYSGNQKQADISKTDTHLFGRTPESEIAIPAYQLRFQVEDTSFVKFYPVIDTTKALVLARFNYYTAFYNNCLIAYRKSDRIFPFHYFW